MVDVLRRAPLNRRIAQHDLAAGGLQLPGDQVEQRRLARTVGANHRMPFAVAQFKLCAANDVGLAKGFVHVV